MTITYPITLDNFTNPTPTNNLNTPAVLHSTQHSNLNDAVEALQAKVGVNSSVVTSSLDYKVSQLVAGNTVDVTLLGQNYLSIVGQVITAAAVNLSGTHVTGVLAATSFPALSGDIATTAGSLTTTLATVNTNIGTFGSGSNVGTFTVNAKGLITAASNAAISITSGAITDFTEAAQDAAGAMVDTTLVYVDATPLLTRAALTGDITAAQGSNATVIGVNKVLDTMIRQSAALSIIGNATNALANVADITAASDFQVLRRSGTALAFGSVNLASANAVTGLLGVANGGTGLGSGTSGGLLYYSDTATIASSGAYGVGAVLYGGGAGSAPSTDASNFFYDGTNHRLGLGTIIPSYAIDVVTSGNAALRLANVTTNAVNKLGRIAGRQYTNADTDFLAFDIRGLSADNQIYYGGGSAVFACVQEHVFFTAASNTTLTGTEAMRITSAGYVGISVTPTNILQVGTGRLRISNGTTDYTLIGTLDPDGSTNTRIVLSGNTRVGSSGNIEYVATSAGFHGWLLAGTTGTMKLNSNEGVSIGSSYYSITPPAAGLIVAGNLGVGNSAPTTALDVSGIIKSGTGGGTIYWQRNLTDLAARRNWGWSTEVSTTGDFVLMESNANNTAPTVSRVTLLSGGDFGIGITPSYRLDVSSGGIPLRVASSSQDCAIRYECSGTGGRTYHVGSSGNTSGAGNGFSVYDVTGGAARLLIDPSGNLGLPVTLARTYLSAGTHNFSMSSTTGNRCTQVIDSTDQRLVLGAYWESGVGQYSYLQSSNDAETGFGSLFLNPAGGNVGINALTALYQLDVVGAIRISAAAGSTFSDTGRALDLYAVGGQYRIGFDSVGGTVGYIRHNIAGDGTTNTWGHCFSTSSSGTPNTFTNTLFVGASGYVGIGITSPNHLLHIHNTTGSGVSWTQYTNATTGTTTTDGMVVGLANSGEGYVFVRENQPLYFGTNNTTYMTLAASGGLSVTTLTASGSLTTVGDASIHGTSITDASIEINSGGSGNRFAYIDFHGDDTYTDYSFRIIRSNSGANSGTSMLARGTGGIAIKTEEAGLIEFFTTNTSRIMIAAAGNVGVNTTAPTEQLEVNRILRVSGTGATNGMGMIALGNHDNGAGYYDNGIYRGGIGTLTSDNYLNVCGYQGIAFNCSNNPFGSQTTRLIISAAGNVGLGTGSATSPSYTGGATLTMTTGNSAMRFGGMYNSANPYDDHFYLSNNFSYGTQALDSASYGTSAIDINADQVTGGMVRLLLGAVGRVPVEAFKMTPSATTIALPSTAAANTHTLTGNGTDIQTWSPTTTAAVALSAIVYNAYGGDEIGGYKFTVGSKNICVTELCSFYYAGVAFLSGNRIVSIFDNDGNLVVTATIASTDTINGDFKCKTLTSSVILYAGQSYTILGQVPNGDSFSTFSTTTFAADITFVATRSVYDQTAVIYTAANGSGYTYNIGASFRYVLAQDSFKVTADGVTCRPAGAIATTATQGYLQLPTCAGTPTGVPAFGAGSAVYDTTNNKILVYNGAWKTTVALT